MTGSRLPNRPYFGRTRRKRGHLVQKLPHSAETPPPAGCMRAEMPPRQPAACAQTPRAEAPHNGRDASPAGHIRAETLIIESPADCSRAGGPPRRMRSPPRVLPMRRSPLPACTRAFDFRSAGVRSVPKPFAPPKSFLAISPAKPVKLQQITTVRKNFP